MLHRLFNFIVRGSLIKHSEFFWVEVFLSIVWILYAVLDVANLLGNEGSEDFLARGASTINFL